MKIPLTYNGPFPEVQVPIASGGSITVKRGESADLPKEIADRLLSSRPKEWQQGSKGSSKKKENK